MLLRFARRTEASARLLVDVPDQVGDLIRIDIPQVCMLTGGRTGTDRDVALYTIGPSSLCERLSIMSH